LDPRSELWLRAPSVMGESAHEKRGWLPPFKKR
jgi:hypothetical protein